MRKKLDDCRRLKTNEDDRKCNIKNRKRDESNAKTKTQRQIGGNKARGRSERVNEESDARSEVREREKGEVLGSGDKKVRSRA
jgi:hypothetical protein